MNQELHFMAFSFSKKDNNNIKVNGIKWCALIIMRSHVFQGDPAWAGRLEQMIHCGPSQPEPFWDSVIC